MARVLQNEGGEGPGETGVGLCVPTRLSHPHGVGSTWNPEWNHAEGIAVDLVSRSVSVQVVNVGNVGSELAQLDLIAWEVDSAGKMVAKIVPAEDVFPVKAYMPGDKSYPAVTRNVILPNDIAMDRLSHLYAIASDFLFDPLDPPAEQFMKDSAAGLVDLESYPAMLSRHVACWTRPGKAFRVEPANRIWLQGTWVAELKLKSHNAGANAHLWLDKPLSSQLFPSMLSALPGSTRHVVLALSEVEFQLRSDIPNTFLSTDAGHARVSVGAREATLSPTGQGDLLQIEWEDSNDNDFNDYVVQFRPR
jgi:hypothetical protein